MEEPPVPEQAVDLEAVRAELRAEVARRRAEGEYPPGLEDDLEAHFRRIVAHRPAPDTSGLEAAARRLAQLPGLSPARIPLNSGVPGAAALHRGLARVVGRQTQGILEQVQEVTDALRDVVAELTGLLGEGGTHVHPDLVGMVDTLQERLSDLERQPARSPAALAELGRRLERLEAAEARRRFRPPFRAEEFENRFRGTPEDLAGRYRELAQGFGGHGPVLDVGCGRGEMLQLLTELGIEARGVELDPELVEAARSRGLDVELGDGLSVLASLPEASLGGLVLIQVVEHLAPQDVADLVSLAYDKLRPGGRVVIETVNPQSLYVYARAFYVDPTHERPVHPAYLAFLFEHAGFPAVDLQWRSPPPESEVLVPVGDPVQDANVQRINQLLFAPQDYALVATR